MHNVIVRTLTGVQHVLELKKNLISLSTPESNGCKYTTELEVLRVMKGALLVMKEKIVKSHYLFQGSTAKVIIVVSSLKDSDSDTTDYGIRDVRWNYENRVCFVVIK